jgi:hypothetical protein
MSNRCSGRKPPSSSTIHDPHDHGPSSTLHNDLAQPVPAVHHTKSAGVQANQNRAAMRLAYV